MENFTVVAIDADINSEEAQNDRAARTESGRAEHVTILMPVGFPTLIGHATGAGGTTAKSIFERPAVAVDGVLQMRVGNWEPNSGDTTEVTEDSEATEDSEVSEGSEDLDAPPDHSTDSAVEVVTAVLLPDEILVAEETREVDFGWAIVVGELSPEDFNKILSFPELVGTDGW